MLHCGACGKFLSPTGAAVCSVCPLKYHRDCLAITGKAPISKDWMCPNCKKNIKRADNKNTPVKALGESAADPAAGSACGIPEVTSPSREKAPGAASDNELSISELRREFTECIGEMREFRREIGRLRESFVAIMVRLDGVEERLQALEQAQSAAGLENVARLEETVAALKRELSDRDQEALLSDLEIGHLPEERGENVVGAVTALAARMGVALEARDIVYAERVGARPGEAGAGGAGAEGRRARRVVVRLARRQLRDELLQAARVRRTLAAADGTRVFVNERLTRQNRQLFHRAREECRRLQWRYAWTKRGRVLVRQGDGKPVFSIRASDDLARVFGLRPV